MAAGGSGIPGIAGRARLADFAEAVRVAEVARIHARPARELAFDRLKLLRDLVQRAVADPLAEEISGEPHLDLQRERFGPGELGLDALDLIVTLEPGVSRGGLHGLVEQAK